MPPVTLIHAIDFGQRGNAQGFKGAGWGQQEADYSLVAGPIAQLDVPEVPQACATGIVFSVGLTRSGAAVAGRVLAVLVNGERLARVTVRNDTVFAVTVPACGEAGRLRVDLRLQGGGKERGGPQPKLGRPEVKVFTAWVFAVHEPFVAETTLFDRVIHKSFVTNVAADAWRATGLKSDRLLEEFASLGHTCDFGLVQRDFGVSALGLLRFAAIETPDLVRGLVDSFDGLGEAASLRIRVPPGAGEYWVEEKVYGMHLHTQTAPSDASAQQVLDRMVMYMQFTKRTFIEDLQLGRKIYLLRRHDAVSAEEAMAVWLALNCHGKNWLLVVAQSRDVPAGTVVKLGPRLLLGHIDGVAETVPPSKMAWLAMCANAFLARREAG
jgi:hypothetical protein